MRAQFGHRRVIDTALLFPASGHYKYKLRHLAERYLQRTIQSGAGGHCSAEDALACLDLVHLKLRHGACCCQQQQQQQQRNCTVCSLMHDRHGEQVATLACHVRCESP